MMVRHGGTFVDSAHRSSTSEPARHRRGLSPAPDLAQACREELRRRPGTSMMNPAIGLPTPASVEAQSKESTRAGKRGRSSGGSHLIESILGQRERSMGPMMVVDRDSEDRLPGRRTDRGGRWRAPRRRTTARRRGSADRSAADTRRRGGRRGAGDRDQPARSGPSRTRSRPSGGLSEPARGPGDQGGCLEPQRQDLQGPARGQARARLSATDAGCRWSRLQ